MLTGAAAGLEKAGADFVVLCTNTMHRVAEEIQSGIGIPLLNIADATAEEILIKNIKYIGLLGTKYTMEHDFYKSCLEDKGIQVMIPGERDRAVIHQVIYEELCMGRVIQESRDQFRRIMDVLAGRGAEGIILGCTEIGLLVKKDDAKVPLFDTTFIHAVKAVEYALR